MLQAYQSGNMASDQAGPPSERKFSRSIVLLATIDIRNAFSSAKLVNMIDARESIQKAALRPSKEGNHLWISHWSILAQNLWNASYDGVFNVEMLDDCYLVEHASSFRTIQMTKTVKFLGIGMDNKKLTDCSNSACFVKVSQYNRVTVKPYGKYWRWVCQQKETAHGNNTVSTIIRQGNMGRYIKCET